MTAKNSSFSSAARTMFVSGSDTIGLVQISSMPLMSPSRTAWNCSW
jgi:hypothetical protein